jgi:CDP-glucose 4,6-dehydratase
MNREFWRGRRVLLTGHTGFKGTWLTLWLKSLGAEVFGFALNPVTEPALFDAVDAGSGINSRIADIRDFDAVRFAVAEFKPEVVMHLAAQALVRDSYVNPVDTYAVNVMGTAHILEAVRSVGGVSAVVIVTSDKCYANREWVWGYREDEPMGGHDPYSSSKGCAELITSAYASSFFAREKYGEHGVAVASARAGNVIGGGDWAKDRLVPDIVRSFQTGQAVTVRNPNAVRPWQHVLEPLRGYLMLAERLVTDGPEFAATETWGDGARWELDGSPQPHEAHYLKLDCSKARTILGWRPVLDLAAALERTVRWYQEFYLCRETVRGVNDLAMREIAAYEARFTSTLADTNIRSS